MVGTKSMSQHIEIAEALVRLVTMNSDGPFHFRNSHG
jgi:hypothetical protein